MTKKDTSLGRKPDSKRTARRAKRNFEPSRPNRRAERRHQSDLAGYMGCLKVSKTGGKEFTKPGSMKAW